MSHTLITDLKQSPVYEIYTNVYDSMDWDLVRPGLVHGRDHIERVMLYGALLSMMLDLSKEDATLVLQACAYHDIGRLNDQLDPLHGRRGANMLEDILHPENLDIIQAAIATHSEPDERLDYYMDLYNCSDHKRCSLICSCLKDADALDRVRLHDLDLSQLRHKESLELKDFAVRMVLKLDGFPEDIVEEVIQKAGPFYHGQYADL